MGVIHALGTTFHPTYDTGAVTRIQIQAMCCMVVEPTLCMYVYVQSLPVCT